MHSGSAVERALIPDVMQSVKSELDVLMQNYDVLLYSGQLDVIIGALLTDQFVPTLSWPGAGAFTAAPRNVWKLQNDVAGYAKQVTAKTAQGKSITFVRAVVRGAGHIVPFDKPAAALDMVQRFVDGKFW
jgi:vitellogenic carboxypeptidase-like protein